MELAVPSHQWEGGVRGTGVTLRRFLSGLAWRLAGCLEEGRVLPHIKEVTRVGLSKLWCSQDQLGSARFDVGSESAPVWATDWDPAFPTSSQAMPWLPTRRPHSEQSSQALVRAWSLRPHSPLNRPHPVQRDHQGPEREEPAQEHKAPASGLACLCPVMLGTAKVTRVSLGKVKARGLWGGWDEAKLTFCPDRGHKGGLGQTGSGQGGQAPGHTGTQNIPGP